MCVCRWCEDAAARVIEREKYFIYIIQEQNELLLLLRVCGGWIYTPLGHPWLRIGRFSGSTALYGFNRLRWGKPSRVCVCVCVDNLLKTGFSPCPPPPHHYLKAPLTIHSISLCLSIVCVMVVPIHPDATLRTHNHFPHSTKTFQKQFAAGRGIK